MELVNGEIKLIKNMILNLDARFNRIEQFLAAQFEESFDNFGLEECKITVTAPATSLNIDTENKTTICTAETDNSSSSSNHLHSDLKRSTGPTYSKHQVITDTTLFTEEPYEEGNQFADEDFEDVEVNEDVYNNLKAEEDEDFEGLEEFEESEPEDMNHDFRILQEEEEEEEELIYVNNSRLSADKVEVQQQLPLNQSSSSSSKKAAPKPMPVSKPKTSKDPQSKKGPGRPNAVTWVLEGEFTDAASADAFVYKERLWAKSFANDQLKGRQQYFQCRFTRKCPARVKVFYRIGKSVLVYRTPSDHDHVGIKRSTYNRISASLVKT